MKRKITYSAAETFKIPVNDWWMVVTFVFRWNVFVRITTWVINQFATKPLEKAPCMKWFTQIKSDTYVQRRFRTTCHKKPLPRSPLRCRHHQLTRPNVFRTNKRYRASSKCPMQKENLTQGIFLKSTLFDMSYSSLSPRIRPFMKCYKNSVWIRKTN